MAVALDRIAAVVSPVLDGLGLALYDVDVSGSGRGRTVRVLVDREGGVDLETIAAATNAVSPVLDRADLVPGPYTLEVSSPGLERPLRRPEHFAGAVGATVSVKVAGARTRGLLTEADDDGIILDVDGATQRIPYSDVVAARTVFEWGSHAETRR